MALTVPQPQLRQSGLKCAHERFQSGFCSYYLLHLPRIFLTNLLGYIQINIKPNLTIRDTELCLSPS